MHASRLTTKTAKLVRWLQVHVIVPCGSVLVLHPYGVHSCKVKSQETHISELGAKNYNKNRFTQLNKTLEIASRSVPFPASIVVEK